MINQKNAWNVSNAFNRAAHDYDSHNHVQLAVGRKLISLLKPHLPPAARAIDLGCGSGVVTALLAAAGSYQALHAIDIAEKMVAKARLIAALNAAAVYEKDFETIADDAFDLVFSNMALHWSRDFVGLVRRISASMNADGVFAFSMPLTGTFAELREFAVNEFYEFGVVNDLLLAAGFAEIISCCEKITVEFADTYSALKSIKKVGANFVKSRQQRGLRKGVRLLEREMCGLTYHVGYFVLRRQPK